jgi:hypothetical protein
MIDPPSERKKRQFQHAYKPESSQNTKHHELTAAIAKAVGIIKQRRYLEEKKWQRYQKRVFRYSGTCAFMRVSTLNKN